MSFRRIASVILLLLCVKPDADAHTRSESYSHWHESATTITATITIPLREVMLLYEMGSSAVPPNEIFRDELVAKTEVRSESGVCEPQASNILRAASGFVRVEMQFDCGDEMPASIRCFQWWFRG